MITQRGPGLGFNPQPDPPGKHRMVIDPNQSVSRGMARTPGGGWAAVPLYSNPNSTLTFVRSTVPGESGIFSGLGAETKKVYDLGVLGHPAYRVFSLATTLASIYHGYKRNNGSIGWAIGWMFVPSFIAAPLMLAQGFGKPKKA